MRHRRKADVEHANGQLGANVVGEGPPKRRSRVGNPKAQLLGSLSTEGLDACISLSEHFVRNLDTLVTDVDSRSSDQLSHLGLALAAERAIH